ncbi:hypothetical protein Tco_1068265 [Tanacetum coccineum]|uniref:Uncharacterized protein n=1 Tax=Tanacetum coccineum TaxID=301880 RepID=A0ABQ5HF80_9ASTR
MGWAIFKGASAGACPLHQRTKTVEDWAASNAMVIVKDEKKDSTVITIDAFLKLLVWTSTVVSKGDPIPDNQHLELRTTSPLAVRQLILEKSPKTLSPTHIHHAASVNETITAAPNDTAENVINVINEIVDLSGNTHVTTPPAVATQPSPHHEHRDNQENVEFSDAHSFHFVHHEDIEEDAMHHRFVPNLGLRDDLLIFTFRACKELVSHLATPTEYEFLGSLSNVEVVSHAYQSLVRSLEDRPLKQMLENNGLSKKFVLLDNAHSTCLEKERELMDSVKEMERQRERERERERERDESSLRWRRERDGLGKTAPRSRRREVFRVNKERPIAGLKLARIEMGVSPDVPPSTTKPEAGTSTAIDTGAAALKSPPPNWMTEDVPSPPFGTTT